MLAEVYALVWQKGWKWRHASANKKQASPLGSQAYGWREHTIFSLHSGQVIVQIVNEYIEEVLRNTRRLHWPLLMSALSWICNAHWQSGTVKDLASRLL